MKVNIIKKFENFVNENKINESKTVTLIPNFNLESDVFIATMEALESNEKFQHIFNKYGKDLLTGANPQNIYGHLKMSLETIITDDMLDSIMAKINNKTLRISYEESTKSRVYEITLKLTAKGIVQEILSDNSNIIQKYGDDDLKELAKKESIQRGKEKFKTMMDNNKQNESMTTSARFYHYILEGDEATEEMAYDAARGLDWQEIESSEGSYPYLKYIDTVNGVEIYYNYGADSYYFAEEEEK